jgi:hypothetical protein
VLRKSGKTTRKIFSNLVVVGGIISIISILVFHPRDKHHDVNRERYEQLGNTFGGVEVMHLMRSRYVVQRFYSLPKFAPSQLRLISSSAHDDSKPIPAWINKFNDSISTNIYVTVPFFLGIRNATWYGLVFAISQTMAIGPEFGVAYMITKFTGKFRQPMNVALAAGISEAVPMFRHIKASALFGALPPDNSVKLEPPSNLEKFANWISGPLDKYGRKFSLTCFITVSYIYSGFSYYVASKVSLFSSVAGIATLIRYGVDVSSVLTSLGINDTMQDAAGAMGASTLINVLLLPMHLIITTYSLPVINSVYEVRKFE